MESLLEHLHLLGKIRPNIFLVVVCHGIYDFHLHTATPIIIPFRYSQCKYFNHFYNAWDHMSHQNYTFKLIMQVSDQYMGMNRSPSQPLPIYTKLFSMVFGLNFINLSFMMIVQDEFEWSKPPCTWWGPDNGKIHDTVNQHLANQSLVLVSVSMPEHAYRIMAYTGITSVEESRFEEVIMSRTNGPSLAQKNLKNFQLSFPYL